MDSNSSGLFNRIPGFDKIITNLSKGNLKANFNHKSKLCHSLFDILFDGENDELSFFVLYMESVNSSNYLKFLLDVNNFEKTFDPVKTNKINLPCQVCKLKDKKEKEYANQCKCQESLNKNVTQDAISIYSRYISIDAKYSIEASDDIITKTISKICPENGSQIEYNCFKDAKDIVFNLIEKKFYGKYLLSEYHCKYLKIILDEKNIKLSDILYDDIAVFNVLEFLEQENASDLLKFWIQVENFSRNLLNTKKSNKIEQLVSDKGELEALYKQWQNDAMVIYDNFISLQAKHALGFDDLIRNQVESNICHLVDWDIDDLEYLVNSYSNCFYVPMLIVYSVLEEIYYQKFLNSHMYKKYVDEITFNTEIRINKEATKLSKSEDLTKKTNSLKIANNEEDSLWKRPKELRQLQLGCIDSTGRFIRNFKSEPECHGDTDSINSQNKLLNGIEDDAWSLDADINIETTKAFDTKSLKSKFEKLVSFIPSRNSSSRNEEQEMAERIAASLVNDVIRSNQL